MNLKTIFALLTCLGLMAAAGCKSGPCPTDMQAKLNAELANARAKPVGDERDNACAEVAKAHKAHDGCKLPDTDADGKNKKFDVDEMEKNCKAN